MLVQVTCKHYRPDGGEWETVHLRPEDIGDTLVRAHGTESSLALAPEVDHNPGLVPSWTLYRVP